MSVKYNWRETKTETKSDACEVDCNTDATDAKTDSNNDGADQSDDAAAAAFEELVLRYQNRLLTVLEHLVGNKEQAEDLAQDVFVRVFKARARYQPEAKFSTWLFTIANNVASNADLSMSWESVRAPPVSAPPKPSPSANPVLTPRANGTPTIPQRSGAPRFGAPPGATPHTETFAPLSFPASAGTPGISAFPPSISAGGAARTSTARPGSLFETAGSANQTPNAFYTPPTSIAAGAASRRALAQNTSTVQRPSASPQRPAPASVSAADGDVTMQTDEDAIAAELADVTQPEDPPIAPQSPLVQYEEAESPTTEFATSVFGRGGSAERQRAMSARRIRKEKSDSPFIPGGFGPVTTDDEAERFSMPPPPPPAATRKPRTSVASASARSRGSPEPPEPRKTRARSGSTAKRGTDLRRSIPGGFATEEDEEEDAVAPLPQPTPAKRGGRKPRASKAGSEKDEMTTEELRPRRSTRLSTAPSVGESSPEPSPTKPSAKARSTRKSTAAAASTSRSSRKKR